MQNKHLIIGTIALLVIGGVVLNTVVEARVAPIGTKFAARHSDGMQDRMIERVMKKVELDDRQREAAYGIIDAYRPEFDALRDEMRADLCGILTAEQRVRAAELKDEIREEVIELIGIMDPEFDPAALVSGR